MRLRRSIQRGLVLALVGISLNAGSAAAQDNAGSALKAQQLFVRGMTKAYLDDHEAALSYYQQALNLAPNEAAVLSAMAASHEALDNLALAIFYAEQARQHAADNAFYHRQLATLHHHAGDFMAALQVYETLLGRFPDDDEALQALAELQTEMGRTGDAIATYQRLIAQAGDHPRLRRQILQLYFRLGDEAGTRRSLEALIALEPADPAPYRLLGQLYLQTNKQEEALEAYEQAYAINPDDLETMLALTDLYRQLDREADAARLDRAMNAEDAAPGELVARAAPLYDRADADADARRNATALLERALALEPNNADALLMLGTLRYWDAAFAEAAPLLEQAVMHNPRDPALWHRAAAAYREVDQPTEALRLADEGLLLFPGHLPLLQIAGHSLLDAERYAEAQARFEEALAIYAEDPTDDPITHAAILTALGDVHARLGDGDAARRLWREALDLAPDNQAVQDRLDGKPF